MLLHRLESGFRTCCWGFRSATCDLTERQLLLLDVHFREGCQVRHSREFLQHL